MTKAESLVAVHTHTHTHTSKLIQINKGRNASICDDIKDRLLCKK